MGVKRRRQEHQHASRFLQQQTMDEEQASSTLSSSTSSLFYYDRLRGLLADGALRGETVEGSSIVKIPDQNIRLMHVSALLGYSRDDGATVFEGTQYSTKAALMAMHHFNHQMDSIVPDLKQQLTDSNGTACNLRMTMDFFDTERAATTGAALLARRVHAAPHPHRTTAVLGAARSAVSVPLAVLNTVRNVPQISYASTSTTLDDRETFRLFGRTIPSNDGDAQAAMAYYSELGVTHLGILYVQDEYGTAYRLSLARAGREKGIQTSFAAIIWDQSQSNENGLRDGVKDAIATLKKTGYRYMMGIIYYRHLGLLVEEATAAGIMGSGYLWVFGDGILPAAFEEGLRYPVDSPQVKAIQGLGLLSVGAASEHAASTFNENWNNFGKIGEFPIFFESKSPKFTENINFERNFTFPEPTNHNPALAYDAIMALGIAGCQAKGDFFNGQDLFDKFLEVDFDGASGRVLIDRNTGSRFFNSTSYRIINGVLDKVQDDGTMSLRTYVASEYARHKGQNVSTWENPLGVQYNYSDFTFEPPPSLPPVEVDLHLVGIAFSSTVTAMAGLVMLSAISFAVWTWRQRRSYVIRASQPGFLIAICVGVFLMATSVISLGAENPPMSMAWANAACMMNYWTFVSGLGLAFSAVFAKLWRINLILNSQNQFRRMRVKPSDVLLPGVFIVLSNTVVLALWQALSPLHYVRVDDLHDSVDQYGRSTALDAFCVSADGAISELYFLGTLFFINGSAIVAANIQAFRARSIATEFSESRFIGISMAILLQTLLIALPVFFYPVNTKANYLAKGALMLIAGASILYLMFMPKISYWKAHKKHERRRAFARAQRLNDSDRRRLEEEGGGVLSCVSEHEHESSTGRYLEGGELDVGSSIRKEWSDSDIVLEEKSGDEYGMRIFRQERTRSSNSSNRKERAGSGLRVVSHSIRGSSRSQSGDSSGRNKSQDLSSGDIGLFRDSVEAAEGLDGSLPVIPDNSIATLSDYNTSSGSKLDIISAMKAPSECSSKDGMEGDDSQCVRLSI